MNTGDKQAAKIGFPFGLYLKQLFSADTYVRYINPFSFWRRYRINYLETCYELNTVQHLEHCYQLDCRVTKHTKIALDRKYTDTPTDSLIRQAELNTIYISKPLIKLKYRGVSYYTRDILNIDIKAVKIDPSTAKIDSLKCADNSDNISTPEKFGSN